MHWREIAGSLDDALAAQAELKGKRRRGERIVAAKDSPTVEEYATAWLERKRNLAPGTRASYEGHLRNHVVRVLGPVRVSKLTDEDVLALLADSKVRKLRPATQAGILRVFGTCLQRAVRDGLLPSNPVRLLERDERPKLTSDDASDVRALPSEHIARLLGGAAKIGDDGRARDMLAIAVFSGLRQSELLALKWGDIDYREGFIRVRAQLERSTRTLAPLKTKSARRDVILMPQLARLLRERQLRSRFSTESDFVFGTQDGAPMLHRNMTRRVWAKALDRAGLADEGYDLHHLRHSFASILISQGHDVVFVSRQLGHASPVITLRVYSHLFDARDKAKQARDALEDEFGALISL
ncbi:MAG TPA: tyrosine-type recombinase/integrase [Gaiella sp.]|nr:tyrosine-type recombinase/integrase [Gaiella sp.]